MKRVHVLATWHPTFNFVLKIGKKKWNKLFYTRNNAMAVFVVDFE